jgi:hypothetical protein
LHRSKSGDQPVGRFADDWKQADYPTGRRLAFARCFKPERRHHYVAQGQQCFEPSGLPRKHLLSGLPCTKGDPIDHDAIGVDELRAGKQRTRIDVGRAP